MGGRPDEDTEDIPRRRKSIYKGTEDRLSIPLEGLGGGDHP